VPRMLFATAELRQSRLRFGALTAGAGLLVFVLLFQQALLGTVLDGMSGALARQSAPVLVYARDAQRSFLGSLVLPEQLEAVAAESGVADAAELGVVQLSFQPQGSPDRLNVSLLGYRPDRPGRPLSVDSGRLPDGPGEVVASVEDAHGRYGVGDTITIIPGGQPLEVVGLTRGARWSVGPTLWAPWDTYGDVVRAALPDTPRVLPALVAVQPAAGTSPASLAAQLNHRFPELEALTREEAVASAPGRGAVQAAFGVVMGLAYLVVAVVVGFFFLTMTLSKEASVTTLRAIGATGGYLVRCLLVQVGTVTAGALLLGVGLLAATVPPMRGVLPLEVDVAMLARTLFPAVGVALAGSLAPIRRTLRCDPATILTRQSLAGPG
jgi:hemin transport system permease protein